VVALLGQIAFTILGPRDLAGDRAITAERRRATSPPS